MNSFYLIRCRSLYFAMWFSQRSSSICLFQRVWTSLKYAQTAKRNEYCIDWLISGSRQSAIVNARFFRSLSLSLSFLRRSLNDSLESVIRTPSKWLRYLIIVSVFHFYFHSLLLCSVFVLKMPVIKWSIIDSNTHFFRFFPHFSCWRLFFFWEFSTGNFEFQMKTSGNILISQFPLKFWEWK